MRTPSHTASPARVAAFWFGVQSIWGAVLGIGLQARTIALHPNGALLAFGQIAAAGALAAGLTQVVTGVLADRRRARGLDRRPYLVLGITAAVPALFWFYGAGDFGHFAASVIALQIGMNLAVGPYQALIPDYFTPDRTGRAASWMAAVQSLGNACGAIAATVLAQGTRLAGTLSALLIASAIVTTAHMRAIPLLPFRTQAMPATRAVIDLFISRGILNVGFFTVVGYMYFYVHDTLHVANATPVTGTLVLVFTAAGALGAILAGKPSDRFDRRVVVNAGASVFVAGLLIFVSLQSRGAAYAGAGVGGAGWGAFIASDWALGCVVLPRNAMGAAMGVWNLAVIGAQIVAPVLTSALVVTLHVSHAWQAPIAFVLAGCEALAGMVWIWRIPRSLATVSHETERE